MRRIVLLALAASLSGGSLATAAEVLAPPNWDADRIRAARPLAPVEVLSFDVTSTVTSNKAPPKTETDHVVLAPTFIEVVRARQTTLYDQTLCRRLDWFSGRTVLSNVSCYATPAFRELELGNRRALAARANPADKTVAAPDPAGAALDEAELGVIDPGGKPLIKQVAGDAVEYRAGGKLIARVAGQAATLTPDETRRFIRYLAQEAPLHPQARNELAAAHRLPRTLAMTTASEEAPSRTLEISNVQHGRAAYPLPDGLTALGEGGANPTPSQRGRREAFQTADGHSTVPKPSETALIDHMGQALKAERPMEAMFVFMALSEQYGALLDSNTPDQAKLARTLEPMIRQTLSNPDAAKFWAANTLAGDPAAEGDREAAARLLAGPSLDGLPFSGFRYLTYANLIRNSPGSSNWDPAIAKSMPGSLEDDYWTAIAAYPWASGPYKDLGDDEMTNFEAGAAWLAFDMGRVVDPDWAKGPMGGIGAFEDQLRTREPDFF